MAGGLAADIAVRVVADIGFGVIACVAVLVGADTQTAIAIAITIVDIVFIVFIILFVFVFILPHIVAIAETLDDQTIALSTTIELTAPACCHK